MYVEISIALTAAVGAAMVVTAARMKWAMWSERWSGVLLYEGVNDNDLSRAPYQANQTSTRDVADHLRIAFASHLG
jgi:hypothetical protein